MQTQAILKVATVRWNWFHVTVPKFSRPPHFNRTGRGSFAHLLEICPAEPARLQHTRGGMILIHLGLIGILKTKNKQIPIFEPEKEENDFWSNNDLTDYLVWQKAKKIIFPELKPSLKSISIRLPESMIAQLKSLANKQDVPYQSLVKTYLTRQINQEWEIHP